MMLEQDVFWQCDLLFVTLYLGTPGLYKQPLNVLYIVAHMLMDGDTQHTGQKHLIFMPKQNQSVFVALLRGTLDRLCLNFNISFVWQLCYLHSLLVTLGWFFFVRRRFQECRSCKAGNNIMKQYAACIVKWLIFRRLICRLRQSGKNVHNDQGSGYLYDCTVMHTHTTHAKNWRQVKMFSHIPPDYPY